VVIAEVFRDGPGFRVKEVDGGFEHVKAGVEVGDYNLMWMLFAVCVVNEG
jgi:hypothetical protein